ncbi:imidazoleglycerol-phosphate synthase [Microbacterium testaceum StLB037]|uniref:Imidazoleglycerol-phosphate synthase n=1 Tax=Microbacterium testaceum (strain StLB037) TaxID=979556 RepID=E8NC63_MICTS|nr:hypothetical protein [Microbacterium testaceum]BAJ76106.1 imidazoleglycerol-phosphate synthase [Microbacterium testaceum StLB037]
MSSSESPRALPLPSSCPAWCVGDHDPSTGADVAHRSEGLTIPGVERSLHPHGDIHAIGVTEITIGLEQSRGETWVWFGSDQFSRQSTVLSIETTKRLVRAVTALLDGAP